MGYKSLQKDRQSIKKKLGEAQAELSELEVKRDELMDKLEDVEDQRINEAAKVKVGSGSKKKSKAAAKEYKKVKSNLDEVRNNIAVSKKAIEYLEAEKADIESEFMQAARKKWNKRAGKHLSNIHDLMQKIEDEISAMYSKNAKDMQKDGFHNPSRQFFNGITRKSQPIISKGKMGADIRNFITANNLNQD